MTPLLWSALTLLAATAVHLLLWRIRLPRRQTRALLLIYLTTLAATLALLAARASPPAELLQIALLVIASTFAYIINYSAVEADSPTLVIIRAIAAAGPSGLPPTALHAHMTDDVLVQPRLDDLIRDRMATLDAGRYTPTPKGRTFVGLLIFFRGLLRADKGG